MSIFQGKVYDNQHSNIPHMTQPCRDLAVRSVCENYKRIGNYVSKHYRTLAMKQVRQ